MERNSRPKRINTGIRRRKVCQFCADQDKKIDYKDAETLKKYITMLRLLRNTSQREERSSLGESRAHAQCIREQLPRPSREPE